MNSKSNSPEKGPRAQVVVRRVGSSPVITLPRPILESLEWEERDEVVLRARNGKLIVTRKEVRKEGR